MAIDTAEKRRSSAGTGLPCYGPGVTPNVSKDIEWRYQAGYSYSGVTAASPPTVAQQMDWLFHTPHFARSARPNVSVGLFALEPIYQAPLAETITLDKWIGSRPDFAICHRPRLSGGMFAPEPIRPGPTLEMWEFKQPVLVPGHRPRPHGGMSAPQPIRPDPIVADWMFQQPAFVMVPVKRAVGVGVFVTDPVTPMNIGAEMTWLPAYPVFVRGAAPRPMTGMTMGWLGSYSEAITMDKWQNYLPVMVPPRHPFAMSSAWYHAAGVLQFNFVTVFLRGDCEVSPYLGGGIAVGVYLDGAVNVRPYLDGLVSID